MTILSQAEAIRDETDKGANTADRVGDCLVDIANSIASLFQSIEGLVSPAIHSASFCFSSDYNICATTCADTGTRLALIDGANTGEFKFSTGSGPVVTGADGTFYFSGLDDTKAYLVTFNIAFYYDDTKQVSVGLRTVGESLSSITGALNDFRVIGSGSGERIPLTITAGITGATSCALAIAGEADTTFSLLACNATIVQLGALAAG